MKSRNKKLKKNTRKFSRRKPPVIKVTGSFLVDHRRIAGSFNQLFRWDTLEDVAFPS